MLNNERAQQGLRARNKQDKVDRIQRAARKLFSKKGFDGTTTREIAREAKVGTGTVFVYFPEKTDLLASLFLRDLDGVSDEAFEALTPDHEVTDQLMSLFGAFFDYFARDRRLSRTFVKELLFLEEGHQQRLATFTVRFIDRVARVLGSHTNASAGPMQLATFVFGDYYFTLVCWLSGTLPNRTAALSQLRASIEQRLSTGRAR